MALPIILPPGAVAIYGDGFPVSSPTQATPSGAVYPPEYRRGTIYNIWAGGTSYIYGGDVVVFKEGEQTCRIVTEDNLTYTIINVAKVVTDSILV